ncbi:MAG TPA: helix-turn-helix domain-containing protein [Virgibacillus sp.]|nr:helix-turn-helix domain-containing protein [Virgibacillus sp.]
MEKTLKVTNVISDPTRFSIYQYMIRMHKTVSVLDISRQFEIHPNVARLHLSKLEDIHLIKSHFERTGKGGRPSRLYELSDQVIELNFPSRDYKLLASIAMESFVGLGEPGRQALYATGKKYGAEVMNNYQETENSDQIDIEEKIELLKDMSTMLGMYPDFDYNSEKNSVHFSINNCPFKEVIGEDHESICKMHHAFLKGMFESLFSDIELIETENMFKDCSNCQYIAKLSIV